MLLLLLMAWLHAGAKAVTLWPSPGAIPTTVPAACRAVLTQNITCDTPELVTAQEASGGAALIGESAVEYCTPKCYNSLKTFQTNVDARCGSTLYNLWINSTLQQSGMQLADGLVWAYNLSCLTDSSGFCLVSLYAGNETACSDCTLKYLATLLSSDYGRAKVKPDEFSSLLSSCSVDPTKYPYSYTQIPTATLTSSSSTSTTSGAAATCTGSTYTVGSGDTCQSISSSQGVGTDRMITLNQLDYNCSMLQTGEELCMPDKCTTYVPQSNMTCDEVIAQAGGGFSTIQLISWNPTIHSNCDNLDVMIGRSLCVSPPGAATFSVSTAIPKPTTSQGLNSSLFVSWQPGPAPTAAPNFTTSWYTPTVPATLSTANVTFNDTVSSLAAQRTTYCWLQDDDWENGFYPDLLPQGCQALVTSYCLADVNAPVPTSPARIPAVCTPDRSDYDDSPDPTTTAAAATPTPFQPGMISGCQNFYKVQSGDTCQAIADEFHIDLTYFYGWNPDVGSSCQALFLGYYVCVSA
ncbi:putative LysM domain-containing protein [Seiridium unicorne]|uniref:LysM domain-containing protein n=1 Tax=Seiridium unicorne TaxID=138068 RepID=A0ABR2V7E6_9PEZI